MSAGGTDSSQRSRPFLTEGSPSAAISSSPQTGSSTDQVEGIDQVLLVNLSSTAGYASPPSARLGSASRVPRFSIPSLVSGKSHRPCSPRASPLSKRRVRAHSFGNQLYERAAMEGRHSPPDRASLLPSSPRSPSGRHVLLQDTLAKARSRDAQRVNDSMVYLDGPQVYTCAQCRTHFTSHDDIISKSFHGRHGRAYLFDQCVNVTIGPSEERRLITGLHTVCDIFCKRCKTLVGWTYLKAFEASQKYKEGKYIIEKINLHLEESIHYDVAPPAGERTDRWRRRSMSWSDNVSSLVSSAASPPNGEDGAAIMVFEYSPSAP